MGAYFLLYPRATVLTLVPIFYFIRTLVLPAYFFLGIWFVLQFFQGTLASTTMQTGGVAWWAHVGGFAAGVIMVLAARSAGVLRRATDPPAGTARRVEDYRYPPPW